MSEKKQISNLPIPSIGGLSIYLAQIKKFPMLDAEEEYMLAKNWKENGNLKAAHKLVTSHLGLVAKIAMGYRGYGLPVVQGSNPCRTAITYQYYQLASSALYK